MNDILFALWFFLPAGVANVIPIFVGNWKFIKRFNKPIDFGLTFRGKRVFGDHKTVYGTLIGILAGVLTTMSIQQPLILGILLSIGALGGDMVKSFFKRQLGIASGKTWFPFDQLDYILGALILSAFYIQLNFTKYLLIIAVWFIIHIISTITGYLLKLKSSPL